VVVLFLRNGCWLIIIGFISVVIAGCGPSEEVETYFEEVNEEVMNEGQEVDVAIEELVEAVYAQEPEKAIDILNEQIIPLNESILEKLQNADVSEDDLVTYNDKLKKAVQLNLDKHVHIKDLFDKIIVENENDNSEEIDVEANMQKLFDMNEQYIETSKDFKEAIEQIEEDGGIIEIDEDKVTVDIDDIEVDEMNNEYEQLVMMFIESINGSSSNEENEASDIGGNILADQGNTEVMFDGKVTIDETLKIQGKSNLPEDAVLQMKTYEYGTENPYFNGEIEVEEDGGFELEADIEGDTLDGELLVVRLAYIPDSKENETSQSIYGEEGEKLEGDFIQPYTDIKRTRHGAFAYAYLKLEEGAEAPLEAELLGEKPDDYGDLDVWMKESNIDTHDNYYDITMKSNLHKLTDIKAEIEVPGYEVSGYRSNTKVLLDGSFRFQIPRPDVDSEEVTVVIHGMSDKSIETEELYGENGERFAGDLVEETKKGKQIEYKISLEEDSQ